MIKVWTDAAEAGLLDRFGARGSTFVYLPGAPPVQAVSVTMPVRLPSWNIQYGLPPIFEMNLPEGVLRERLRLAFAKATGTFDEFDLLGIVGRSQLGRIRYTGQKEQLQEDVPFQSVDEILGKRRGRDLFRYLIDKFAPFSGISGVQPKILVRDETAFVPLSKTKQRLSQSYRGATHIVKFWEQNEYPQLAANEYFCLKIAEQCGLDVPTYRLAEDGLALVVDRFDLRPDGTYRGFEDFCVLNACRTDEKYRGSYETSIMKRFAEFANSSHVGEDMERLFTLCVFRSKWASDSTGSGTRFRLKRDMIPLGSGPHFGLERNAVPHGTESRPAWNGTGDGGVESEQAALVIPGRCFPEVKGEYFARTEITHEKNTRNPTPPF
jgi:serine/threonine-protein kinase HipA